MQDFLQPILHKAPVYGLRRGINRTGLSIGDAAELFETEDGRIGVSAPIRRRFLFLTRREQGTIGCLGPAAAALVAPLLARRGSLRVRIVGITPEHLAPDGKADLHVSVWGNLPSASGPNGSYPLPDPAAGQADGVDPADSPPKDGA